MYGKMKERKKERNTRNSLFMGANQSTILCKFLVVKEHIIPITQRSTMDKITVSAAVLSRISGYIFNLKPRRR